MRRSWPTIRPGILTVTSGGTQQKIIVLGGLAEVSDKGLTVLADVATSMRISIGPAPTDLELEAKLAEKEGSELDRAIERLRASQSQLSGRCDETRFGRTDARTGPEALVHRASE